MENHYRKYWDYFNNIEVQKSLLVDQLRVGAYLKAINKLVKPDHVVVDLGTGLGVFAFFAAKIAKKVYAIEATDVINVAKEIAKKNKITNIEFIQKPSTLVELPEKADVLIAEIIGEFGLDENIIHYVRDARERLLKPNPILLPGTIETYIFPFEANTFYDYYIGIWKEKFHDIDFSVLADYYKNRTIQVDFNFPFRPLAEPVLVKRIDLKTATENNLEKELTIETSDLGVIHGFCGYFKAKLANDIEINSSPLVKSTCWRNLCFPLTYPGNPDITKEFEKLRIKVKGVPTKEYMDWSLEILK